MESFFKKLNLTNYNIAKKCFIILSFNALHHFNSMILKFWRTQTFWSFNLVAQSCLTLCHSMNCSTPGFLVYHQLPEFTQTHVHWVGDAVQPSHPLLSLLLLPSVFPSIRAFFQWVSSSYQVAKVLELQHQSFQWMFRVQFSCSVMSDSLWPHGLQHARLLCPPLSLGVCSNSCLLSRDAILFFSL